MTRAHLTSLWPLLILGSTAILVLVGVAIRRSHATSAGLAVLGLGSTLVSVPYAWGNGPVAVTGLLLMDGFAYWFTGMFAAAGLVVSLLASDYLSGRGLEADEFYALLLLATTGASVMAASGHFASFLLGLELLSVSTYAMIAYLRRGARDFEAGVKYLIMAAAGSAFLLFGMALVYAGTGTMDFQQLSAALGTGSQVEGGAVVALGGFALMLVGLGVKLALAPFHMWTPDVYQGAPAPVAAFVSTVSKGAAAAVLVRLFYEVPLLSASFGGLLGAVAVVTMAVGNVLALLQENIKRLLAYSSIAHLGYLMVAVLAGGGAGAESAAFYLLTYVVTMLGAFSVVSVMTTHGEGGREPEWLEDYQGLFWRRPWMSAVFTLMLLSLAGIPLTAGFPGRFSLIFAGAGAAEWGLVVALLVNSAVGLFYYLRVVVTMARPPEAGRMEVDFVPTARQPSQLGYFVLAGLAVWLLHLGLSPNVWLVGVELAVRSIGG